MYSILKGVAANAAQRVGPPSFYLNHQNEIDISRSGIRNNTLIHKCKTYLDESELHPAHGIEHCEKVALEAGAILLIEASNHMIPRAESSDLLTCVQIAGLLHDIKRKEDNHTFMGSLRAEEILNDFDIDSRYKRYISAAIRNHEAFKEVLASEDETAELLSNSLYDADKFRWGPDNFTTTLWLIMESTETTPEMLHIIFEEKMQGIRNIKKTFRTETGRTYGPEFIDSGIEIGNEIYREIGRLLGK